MSTTDRCFGWKLGKCGPWETHLLWTQFKKSCLAHEGANRCISCEKKAGGNKFLESICLKENIVFYFIRRIKWVQHNYECFIKPSRMWQSGCTFDSHKRSRCSTMFSYFTIASLRFKCCATTWLRLLGGILYRVGPLPEGVTSDCFWAPSEGPTLPSRSLASSTLS